jgi:hypothetical protein
VVLTQGILILPRKEYKWEDVDVAVYLAPSDFHFFQPLQQQFWKVMNEDVCVQRKVRR